MSYFPESKVLISRFINTLDSMDKAGTRIPGLLLSHAGFGKTSTVRKFAEVKDYNCLELVPSQYAPDDIVGIQAYDTSTNQLVRKAPAWFRRAQKLAEDKRTILFIDEITTCSPFIQGPLLDLIFSRSIGEEHLPDNVFIIAAGNYSSDLNGEFTMSNPLINRFLLLNLNDDDFDLEEILNEEFENKKSKQEIEEYLGLREDDSKIWDYESVKNWMLTSGNVGFGINNPEEIDGLGLLGFTSARSVNFVNKYLKSYFQTYSDDSWMRIAGDTLGTSRRKENKPMRLIFKMDEEKFCTRVVKSEISLTEMLKEIKSADKVTLEMINNLKKLVTSTPARDITSQNLKTVSEIVKSKNCSAFNGMLNDIITIITNKFNEI